MTYRYIDHIKMTLYLMQTSYNELEILFRERRPEEIRLVNSGILRNYTLSLHYMFVNEFCKLLENPSKRKDENVASLLAWNKYILDSFGESYQTTYDENVGVLDNIKQSAIFHTVRKYRDSRFSHLDGKGGEPFNIPFLKEHDVQLLKEVMTSIKQVVNNCTHIDGYEFEYEHIDDRTDNFIRYHAQYEEFYHKNYVLAMEQGF